MKKEKLVNFEYGAAKNGAVISIIPEINTILLEWKGDVLLEEWIEILSRGLTEIENRKITSWIGDTSLLGAVSDEHNEWVQNFWVPKTLAAGLKKLVIILPKDALGEIVMQELIENVKETSSSTVGAFQSYYTNNLEEAYTLIQSK
jgi:hypothetical protein